MTKLKQSSILTAVDASVPLPTRRVGRFYLTEKLGSGTSGAVFLGHDPVIDRDVAIKILETQGNLAGKKLREQQFINEARAAGRLSHPYIVTIYDASSEGSTTYIAMEFLQGRDLGAMLADGKHFDVIETVAIIKKVAEALAYAHQKGVTHRDIKPANIFILANQEPKVVDFGIARTPNRILEENNLAPHTLFNNNILGTPSYMSPEQALGQQVDTTTDIYSLGAVMYEMLVGQKPFQDANVDKLLQKIAKKMPIPPSELNSKVSKSLSTIIMTAMQKDPALRYQKAEEMVIALDKFLDRDHRLKKKRKAMIGDQRISLPTLGEDMATSTWLSWLALFVAVTVVIGSLFR